MIDIPPKIIRTWFDTVLNPIISSLKREKRLLENGNLTWKYRKRDFEKLVSINDMIDDRYLDNFEQAQSFIEKLRDIQNEHDSELEKLRESCRNLYFSLSESEELLHQIEEIIKKNDDSKVKKEKPEELMPWIAEYIINDLGELDAYYVLHPLWNKNREKLKKVLNNDKLKILHEHFLLHKEKFEDEVEKCLCEIKDLRNELSLKSGEPLVPVEVN